MAEFIQDVILRMKTDTSDAEKGIDDVGEASKKAEQMAGGLGSTLKGLAPALGAAIVVKGLIDISKASLKAADEAAKVNQKLLVAAKGNVAVQKELIKLAGDLQKKTLFGDEASIEASAKLLPLLNGNADAVKKLLPLVQDFATFSGTDLVSAADLVGKSVGTQTNALGRYGIQVEGAVGSAERLESAMNSLNKVAGGQAQAAAKVGLGAWEQFQGILGDVLEEIGFILLEVLRPAFIVLREGASYLQLFIAQLRGAEKATGTWGKVIALLQKPFIKIFNYLKYFYTILGNVSEAFGLFNSQSALVTFAIKGINIVLDYFTKVLNTSITIVTYFAATINGAVSVLSNATTRIKNIANSFKDFDFSNPIQSFKNLGKELKDVGSDVGDDFMDGFNEILKLGRVKRDSDEIGMNIGGGITDGIVDGLSSGKEKVEDAAKEQVEDAAKEQAKTILDVYDELNQKLVELSEQKDQLIKLSSQGASAEIQAQLDDLLNKVEKQISDVTDKLDEFGAVQLKTITIDPSEVIVNEKTIEDLLKKSSENIKPIEYTPPIEITLTEKIEKFKENFSQITGAITDLIDSLGIGDRIQKEIDKYDALIAKQEDVVNKTREIASSGNADQLKLEEDRLKSLESARAADEKKKEQAEKRAFRIKQSIALGEIAINLAKEISAINAYAATLGPAGPGYLAFNIPKAVALSAFEASTVLAQIIKGYHDGTEFVTGQKGRDKIPAMVEYGERIVNADQNKKISQKLGYTPTNDELVKMVLDSKKLGIDNKGLLVNLNVNKKERQEVNELIEINKKMLKALQRNGINIQVDEDGFAIRTQSIVDRNKILDSI